MPEPHDPIDWIKHLEGPEPPANAPDWNQEPQRSPWAQRAAVGTVLAMAAGALLWFSVPDNGIRMRGGEGAVDIDLRVVALMESGPERLRKGEVYPTGQQLVFRLGATPSARVSVWAISPKGRSELGEYDSEPTPADLKNDGGLLALTLDTPGNWTVYASTAGYGECDADNCESRAVVVAEDSK